MIDMLLIVILGKESKVEKWLENYGVRDAKKRALSDLVEHWMKRDFEFW